MRFLFYKWLKSSRKKLHKETAEKNAKEMRKFKKKLKWSNGKDQYGEDYDEIFQNYLFEIEE